ncbi:MAG: formylglycine-generating enzyme family protein [Deltaproteobacteria bacterium]|nr:formylglycine-generating enzyme family protein [Deltaproteobacteria bacterium]
MTNSELRRAAAAAAGIALSALALWWYVGHRPPDVPERWIIPVLPRLGNEFFEPTRETRIGGWFAVCPENFEYFRGGWFVARRTGERWPGDEIRYLIKLEPFCLGRWEASQPTASPTSRGQFRYQGDVPPAQVRPGVLPWYGASRAVAEEAVQLQGWRLPTYEELQYAATRGDSNNIWFGSRETWDCDLSERSWYETCGGPRPVFDDHAQNVGVAGGPMGDSDYRTNVYDLFGNVAEWTATPWEPWCYGDEAFSLFGGHATGEHREQNRQHEDPNNPGCWLMENYGGSALGEHGHPLSAGGPDDDGFRPAANPGFRWLFFEAKIWPEDDFQLKPSCFYLPTGKQMCYQLKKED